MKIESSKVRIDGRDFLCYAFTPASEGHAQMEDQAFLEWVDTVLCGDRNHIARRNIVTNATYMAYGEVMDRGAGFPEGISRGNSTKVDVEGSPWIVYEIFFAGSK